jgi:hypothetical protein
MASSKSTVVGIRLDHERRAWVEAEAARLGVSVRGLFEGMIDEARSAETVDDEQPIVGPGSAGPSPISASRHETVVAPQAGDSAASQPPGRVNAGSSSPWSGVGAVTGVPGGLIREALSLTTSLIELSGRCATKRLSRCVLTRNLGNRSL